MSDNELTGRERLKLHALCRDMDELAERVPWAAWFLRPMARLLRWMDDDLHNRRDDEGYY